MSRLAFTANAHPARCTVRRETQRDGERERERERDLGAYPVPTRATWLLSMYNMRLIDTLVSSKPPLCRGFGRVGKGHISLDFPDPALCVVVVLGHYLCPRCPFRRHGFCFPQRWWFGSLAGKTSDRPSCCPCSPPPPPVCRGLLYLCTYIRTFRWIPQVRELGLNAPKNWSQQAGNEHSMCSLVSLRRPRDERSELSPRPFSLRSVVFLNIPASLSIEKTLGFFAAWRQQANRPSYGKVRRAQTVLARALGKDGKRVLLPGLQMR